MKFFRSDDSKASLNLPGVSSNSGIYRVSPETTFSPKDLLVIPRKADTDFGLANQSELKMVHGAQCWQRAYEWISKLAEMTFAEKTNELSIQNGIDS